MVRHTISDVASGDPVKQEPLERALALLNFTPSVYSRVRLMPGLSAGTTDAIFDLGSKPAVSGDVYVDNHGGYYSGQFRSGIDITVNNPSGYGDQLGLHVLNSEGGGVLFGEVNYLTPNIIDGLRAGVSMSSLNYHLGKSFYALHAHGSAKSVDLFLRYPLWLHSRSIIRIKYGVGERFMSDIIGITGGFVNKKSTYMEASVSGSEDDDFGLGGNAGGSLKLTYGSLGILPESAYALDKITINSVGRYAKIDGVLSRNQKFPMGFVLRGMFSVQWASKNLDSSEQYFLGGPDGVMAYPVGEGEGSQGYLASLVLSHIVKPFHLPGRWVISGFSQYGRVELLKKKYPGFPGSNRSSLGGVGFAMDWFWRRYSLSLAYANRIGPYVASVGPSRGSEVWGRVAVTF
ncbi:ShlB/FhaC/HecB family protein [Acidihalobacter yilgarnensis]|uniref:ShlB/FhaC/HecB family hemolysin secretion/activation protein n=1 Tax=Acidihalobacter yilgarnensis TaxID=2819280 RepID=UPI0012E9A453|nr:ShlB/FhaC/HecB family hemolysin secretion/activation protein [Acidihalobacter yilgarnensis]